MAGWKWELGHIGSSWYSTHLTPVLVSSCLTAEQSPEPDSKPLEQLGSPSGNTFAGSCLGNGAGVTAQTVGPAPAESAEGSLQQTEDSSLPGNRDNSRGHVVRKHCGRVGPEP